MGGFVTESDVHHAYSWTQKTGLTPLLKTANAAADVNNKGGVVGEYGYLWTQDDGYARLGTGHHIALEVNEAGRVVGKSLPKNGDSTQAFTWTPSGGAVDLGFLPGDTSSTALLVNKAGLVAGESSSPAITRAFAWTTADGMFELPGLGGNKSHVIDLNDRGQAIGTSSTATGEQHAVLWTIG